MDYPKIRYNIISMDKNNVTLSEMQTPEPPKLTPIQKFFYGSGCAFELTKWLIVAVVALTLIHFYIATILVVEGLSMEPNFHSGEVIIANRFQYLFRQPERGDAVVLRFPGDPEHTKYIKRIIALPNERVEIKDSQVFINGEKLSEPYLPPGTTTLPNLIRKLGPEDYFLMGDNRPDSSDSRIWGIAPKRDLIGKAAFIIWPFQFFGKAEK